MNESGYYPPGAEFDPHAPYNEDYYTKKVKVNCSLDTSVVVEIEIPEDDSISDHIDEIESELFNTNMGVLSYNGLVDYEEL